MFSGDLEDTLTEEIRTLLDQEVEEGGSVLKLGAALDDFADMEPTAVPAANRRRVYRLMRAFGPRK
ncbi:hypothetical protein FRC09_005010 [Ceratobasidium sp. 395]|nr:hypothetical protein FRC09_005010 [Ceratobasidium sp. 395]